MTLAEASSMYGDYRDLLAEIQQKVFAVVLDNGQAFTMRTDSIEDVFFQFGVHVERVTEVA